MTTLWRPIPGFEDYEASDTGLIRSWKTHFGHTLKKPRLLQGQIKNGRRAVLLCKNHEPVGFMVDHLVLIAFGYPQTPNKPLVRHLNNDTLDCSLSNLEWGNREQIGEDIQRRHLKHGVLCQDRLTQMRRDDDRKKRHKRNRDIVAYVRAGNLQADAARKFKVTEGCVSRLMRGSRPIYLPEE